MKDFSEFRKQVNWTQEGSLEPLHSSGSTRSTADSLELWVHLNSGRGCPVTGRPEPVESEVFSEYKVSGLWDTKVVSEIAWWCGDNTLSHWNLY